MIGFRLFLPEEGTADAERSEEAGIPVGTKCSTKGRIALAHLDWALAAGVRRHVVLADAGYGDSGEFRDALVERGLRYVVAVNGEPEVWSPESKPRLRKNPLGDTQRPRAMYRDDDCPPIAIKRLASTLKFRRVRWREGSKGWQSGQFCAIRIRTARRHLTGAPPGDEQWLLCQETGDERTPYKAWLSNLPSTTEGSTLVDTRSSAGGSNGTTKSSSKNWGSITSRAARGAAFTTTPRSALSLTDFSPSVGRFPPRRSTPWTLPMVRRAIQ